MTCEQVAITIIIVALLVATVVIYRFATRTRNDSRSAFDELEEMDKRLRKLEDDR